MVSVSHSLSYLKIPGIAHVIVMFLTINMDSLVCLLLICSFYVQLSFQVPNGDKSSLKFYKCGHSFIKSYKFLDYVDTDQSFKSKCALREVICMLINYYMTHALILLISGVFCMHQIM